MSARRRALGIAADLEAGARCLRSGGGFLPGRPAVFCGPVLALADMIEEAADTGDDPGPFDRVLDDLADSPSVLDCLTVAQSSLAVLLTATAPDERRAMWGVIAAAHDGCEGAAVRDLIADMLALADRLTAHCEDLP